MFNSTSYYRNANQNQEIQPHTCQNGYYKKQTKLTGVAQDVEKLQALFISVGNIKWFSHYGKEYGSS